jgi:hypothetical protein
VTIDPPTKGQVVSVLPGRVRFRLRDADRALLPRIHQHLVFQPGIRKVMVNEMTGSVLVHCDHPTVSCQDILAMIYDLGVVVRNLEEATEGLGPLTESNGTEKNLIATVDDLDRRLSAATGKNIDLKMVLPLAVSSVGLRQLIVEGLGDTSGLFLLWIGVDMYLRLNRRRQSTSRRRPASPKVAGMSAASAGG